MKLDQYLVIAGVPGVHKLVSTRNNGLVIEDRKEGRTRFVPVRQNQITPIATVGIYVETDEGTVPLTDVFQKMLDQLETTPPVSLDASSAALRAYFAAVLPEHDQDRVNITDIKKCIKWFNFMHEKGIFKEAQEEELRDKDTEDKATAELQDAATAQPENELAEETMKSEAPEKQPKETKGKGKKATKADENKETK
jgi:hypothetical protein